MTRPPATLFGAHTIASAGCSGGDTAPSSTDPVCVPASLPAGVSVITKPEQASIRETGMLDGSTCTATGGGAFEARPSFTIVTASAACAGALLNLGQAAPPATLLRLRVRGLYGP